MTAWDPLDDFVVERFAHEGRTFDVYRQGQGPAVVIVHEIPGITPAVARFARRVAERGFTVFLPHLFGDPGRPESPGYMARTILGACISREFDVLAADRSSPIADAVRALCRHAHAACGGPGVGALGMCLTGNFALALMVDPVVRAPVLSQPSLPFPITRGRAAGVHASPEELAVIRRRVAEEGAKVLGVRFTHDPVCRTERFDRLSAELGDGFERVDVDSGPGNAAGIPRSAHSVLTRDLVDREGHPTRAALDRVLAFFEERLRP